MFEGVFVCLFVFVGNGATSKKLCQKDSGTRHVRFVLGRASSLVWFE